MIDAAYLIAFGICLLGVLWASFMLLRNEAVYKARMKAVEKDTYKSNTDSYNTMMYQFTKWTYKDFYEENK